MSLFQPNIGKTGRIIRGLVGLALLAIAIASYRVHWLAGLIFAMSSVFCLFQALRGWCAARACGVKTRW